MTAEKTLRATVVAIGLAVSAPAWSGVPQGYSPPRMADGHPDFEGVWGNSATATQLETSPAFGDKLVVSAREAQALAASLLTNMRKIMALQADIPDQLDLVVVRGEYRTRLIVEPASGRIPFSASARTAAEGWAAELARVKNGLVAENPESLALSDRCISLGGEPPMHPSFARQIVQSPGYVVIYLENYNETRIVRMAGAGETSPTRTRLGASTGHWDGDVLMVETTGFRLDEPFYVSMGPQHNPPFMVGPDSKVIERFTRVSENELDYTFTIEDPTIYSGSWLGEYALTRTPDQRVWESACHEGNNGVSFILAGARRAEALSPAAKGLAAEPNSKANNPRR